MHFLRQELLRFRQTDSRRAGAARRQASRVEPIYAQRFECKYLVNPLVLPEMRSYLRPFVEPDRYARQRANGRYPVSSLYLDSPDLLLYRQTRCGEKDRFKLRVRTYDDDTSEPAFAEVKGKINSVVRKRRVGLKRADARTLLLGRDRSNLLGGLSRQQRTGVDYFARHMDLIRARPVIRVQYLREAYEARGSEPVRVTMDSDLRHSVTLGDDLGHRTGTWVNTPSNGLIVEIKFTERYPAWLAGFVRHFELRQRSVPKYNLSIELALRQRMTSETTVAGLARSVGRA